MHLVAVNLLDWLGVCCEQHERSPSPAQAQLKPSTSRPAQAQRKPRTAHAQHEERKGAQAQCE